MTGPRPSPRDWQAAGGAFDWRGHRIFVISAGDPAAEPLLLIHGFPTASWDWADVWPALAARYRVHALDLIGFGLSAKPRDYPYSLVDQADLCEAYVRSAGVAAYHVLAHDVGVSVAQELLARQGEPGGRPRLRSVAFLNGGLFPETHRPLTVQRLLLSPLGPLVSRLASRARFSASMRRICGPRTQPGEDLIDGWWSLVTANDGRAVTHQLIRYIAERRERRERWVGALQRTPLPLKLIAGTADPVSGAHMIARCRELAPRVDVTELERIGHYPQVEAPAEVVRAYLAFRAAQPAA